MTCVKFFENTLGAVLEESTAALWVVGSIARKNICMLVGMLCMWIVRL